MNIYTKLIQLRLLYYKLKTLIWYKPFFKNCGSNNRIIKPLLLTPQCVILRSNIFLRDNCRLEGVFSYAGVNYDPLITLNDNISIEQNLHLTCANKITIGANTAIAANVTITDINHPYADISLPPEKQVLQVSEVIIGGSCKIYNNAVLLPGTILGKHNIVGANSVVSGVFPDYCVIAGTPAKIIKLYNERTGKWEKTETD